MSAAVAHRALAPNTSPSADGALRVVVSLSLLSWLTVVLALFWH
ncbi:hypothetical protein [Sphingomonas psychrotolerans]|nr:hypothetical protein [Sphingomonas psychrotolerans]